MNLSEEIHRIMQMFKAVREKSTILDEHSLRLLLKAESALFELNYNLLSREYPLEIIEIGSVKVGE